MELKPLYRCSNTHYAINQFILVTYENGEKEFIVNNCFSKENCIEATANTTYINTIYNCNKCSFGYVPYYSNYYQKVICQNLLSEIVKKRPYFYNNYYNSVVDTVKAINETCEADSLFTLDGDYCYKCDNENVGMPGCQGGCSYSNKRDPFLKCTGKCKKGYFEYSEGICEKCENVNTGCYECHYEEEYPSNYKGIKRKRRFVCDHCEDGYIQSNSGECILRSDLGLFNCLKIKADPNYYNNFICEQCEEDYFINEKGKCEICDASHFQGKNKCIKCSDTSEGGIDNCLYCEAGNEKAICQQCLPGYILSISENSCLQIANNKELEAFTNCDQITKENDKYICSKCKFKYTLITKNNNKECIYARSLYDVNINSQSISNIYIYNRYSKYLPCQEAENLGTEENPLYSCLKCYEFLNSNNNALPLKVTEINSKVSFCLNSDYKGFNNKTNLANCLEATLQIKNGEEIFTCSKCTKASNLTFDSTYQRFICNESLIISERCLIHYCKTCKINDGNICEECLPDYEVNTLTGSCIKKSEEIPSITWKDIYAYDKSDLSLKLRGLTSDQINEGHAFLIYLIFKKKNEIRNLEEEKDTIKMEAICSIEKEVEKSNNELNMVDYKCKGNNIDNINLTFYSLENIEDGSDEKLLKSKDLDKLVSELKKDNDNLEQSSIIYTSPSFSLSRFLNTLIFTMNEKKKFKADNYLFQIQIDGKINKDKFKKDKINFRL